MYWPAFRCHQISSSPRPTGKTASSAAAAVAQAARDGLSPDAWRNYSAFINKLDDAIAAQRKVVEQSRAKTAEGQQAWLAQRTKLKAFDTLSLGMTADLEAAIQAGSTLVRVGTGVFGGRAYPAA